MTNATKRARMDLPISDAVEQKFAEGREHYGPAWVGARPSIEAHDDTLDVLAYIAEEMRQHGAHPSLSEARIRAVGVVSALREYHLLVGDR